MDRKLFIVLVVAGLVGIAWFVKSKRLGGGRGRARTVETAAPSAAPRATFDPKRDACESDCIRKWTKDGASCGVDEACHDRVDGTKDRCMSSCR